jgi:hypothetical protein
VSILIHFWRREFEVRFVRFNRDHGQLVFRFGPLEIWHWT